MLLHPLLTEPAGRFTSERRGGEATREGCSPPSNAVELHKMCVRSANVYHRLGSKPLSELNHSTTFRTSQTLQRGRAIALKYWKLIVQRRVSYRVFISLHSLSCRQAVRRIYDSGLFLPFRTILRFLTQYGSAWALIQRLHDDRGYLLNSATLRDKIGGDIERLNA